MAATRDLGPCDEETLLLLRSMERLLLSSSLCSTLTWTDPIPADSDSPRSADPALSTEDTSAPSVEAATRASTSRPLEEGLRGVMSADDCSLDCSLD